MKYYELFASDPKGDVRLLFTELPGPPFLSIRPRYARFQCPNPSCKKIDHDGVFADGFEAGLRIREKRDLLVASEGFTCVSERVVQLIERCRFAGLRWKPLAGTEWYVLNAECHVTADVNAYQRRGPLCELCGRPREVSGSIQFLRQIVPPEGPSNFFAPTYDRGGSLVGDRDLFLTEDIVEEFRKSGIKGGMCRRLLTSEEEEEFHASQRDKKLFKWPKGSIVVL